MNFNDNILFDWYNTFNFTNEEKRILNAEYSIENSSQSFELNVDVQNRFFSLIKNKYDKENSYVSFEVDATTIIDKLFYDYVTSDTLVITTKCEHPSVQRHLNKLNPKNIFYISSGSFSFLKINELLKKIKQTHYKNVFVYICSITSVSMLFVPQSYIIQLKQTLDNNNIKNTFILDDVQGMFLYQRDYSLFDYVIGTCHALIQKFDMGIVISKDKPYVKQFYEHAMNFFDVMEILFKTKHNLFLFNAIMCEYYYNLQFYDKFKLYRDLPFKFFIIDQNKTKYDISGNITSKLFIIGESDPDDKDIKRYLDVLRENGSIFYSLGLFRSCQAVTHFDVFIEQIHKINNIVNEIIQMEE